MPERRASQLDLPFLRTYLEEFAANVNRGRESDQGVYATFWGRKDHSLHLSQQETLEYQRLLKHSMESVAPNKDMSEKALDSALKDAIFTVVGDSAPDAEQLKGRIDEAMVEFRDRLQAEPEEFECWVPIAGADPKSLPATFASTDFRVIDDTDIDRLKNIVHTKHTADVQGKLDHINRHLAPEFLGAIVAIHRVPARDQDAGSMLAERAVLETIECLNFFAEMMPYNRGTLSVARNGPPSGTVTSLTLASEGSFLTEPKTKPPWTYSFARHADLTPPAAKALERVEALLSVKRRTKVEDLLLRAVRWGGRSAAAETPEYTLLYSLIALESLLLPRGSGELSFRLSRLVARVLGKDQDSRYQLAKDIARLYDLRSKVVHDGRFEVTEDDKVQASVFAHEAITRIVNDEQVAQTTKLDDLQVIFDYRVAE
ncbi:MAG: hypothetical protein F4187_09800 [Gemmatimonadetes bacterium]|nr:hypothetical protein [Chloroflexota bacterium]MYG82021.1 hypothetical protein [Gemmatimonadota bacterium]